MDAAPNRYAELVLWCGGWAGLDCVIDGQVVSEAPEYRQIAECVAVAENLADPLLSGSTATRSVNER